MEKVLWLDWNEETLLRARNEDKPILLDLDATWCHWCHVMEKTTYSDSEVAHRINESFIPIRVDPDRRPDLNDRYNQGGWPTTVILAPSGEVLFGATYLPVEQMHSVLERIIELWHTKREDVSSAIAAYRQRTKEHQAATRQVGQIPTNSLEVIFESSKEQFDFAFGGFGSPTAAFAPKFPFPEMIQLCFLQYFKSDSEEALEMAQKTLDGMLGIFDKDEGGFFRYAVQRNWSEPHYEKMLESNAALLPIYLQAWRILTVERYREVAEGIIQWLFNTMARPGGGFWGSQDADGEELYYGKSRAERAALPSPSVDKTIFTDWNMQMVRSLLDAYIVLERQDLLNAAIASLDFLMSRCRQENEPMYHYCTEEGTYLPGLLKDQAWTILALSRAFQVTADPRYLWEAEELTAYILSDLQDSQGGFFDMPESIQAGPLVLPRRKEINENSIAVNALVEMYQLTGYEIYKEAAARVLQVFAGDYAEFSLFGAAYAIAAWRFNSPIEHIVITGKKNDSAAQHLLLRALQVGMPFSLAQLLDPEESAGRLQQLHLPTETRTVAYLCKQGACNIIKDPAQLSLKILEGLFGQRATVISR